MGCPIYGRKIPIAKATLERILIRAGDIIPCQYALDARVCIRWCSQPPQALADLYHMFVLLSKTVLSRITVTVCESICDCNCESAIQMSPLSASLSCI